MKTSINPFKSRLLTHMVALISIVVFASMALAGTVFNVMLGEIVTKYIGHQSMTVAKMVAMNDQIVEAFDAPDPSAIIQPIAEKIRLETGASYVVVGNTEGIRYSHTNPSQIGKEMVGGDNGPVLEGKSIVSQAVGSLGPSLRGKTPIFNKQGEVIGIASVGFLLDNIATMDDEYEWKIFRNALLLLTLGLIGAYLIARRVKSLIFGLEPEQISFLFKEKEATLESIRDATVAVDVRETIVSMNKRARELFQGQPLSVGGKLQHVQLKEAMRGVAETGLVQTNQRIFLNHEVYLMHVAPIMEQDRARGVVFTFRTESEIEQLTDEFTKIKAFSENMRAQNHEYLNKLNTIYGLLTLQHYEKAIELITEEVRERQDVIALLMNSVKDPLIAACLLGKINRAKELKAQLEIDPNSNLTQIPPDMDTKPLVSILGHLIDNGMEAARDRNGAGAQVKLSFTDYGNDLVFNIEDNGPGIAKDRQEAIFEAGCTSKHGDHRGFGLAIVKSALKKANGQLFIDDSPLGGARFTVVIPKAAVRASITA